MELRTLRYFLAVAQAKTISAAAEALHVTQPTLSRQMQELEEELGKTLFLRGKRSITLTEEGTFFRKRAQEEQRRIQPAGREVHPALECEFAVDLGEEQLLFVGEQKGAAAGREHVAEVLQEGRV